MVVKLFILGLPGSGKSTISQYISEYASDRHWSTMHFYDYSILCQMFKEDSGRQFRPTGYDGFDVLDLSAIDRALQQLEHVVSRYLSISHFEEIILIEFSRNNYEQAFRIFSQEILKDAYFLHLNVDLDICK